MTRSWRIGKVAKLQKARALPDLECHYCSRQAATYDHIVPKSLGGSNAKWNRVPSCLHCNGKKTAKMPTCECQRCRQAVVLFESYKT